MSEMSSISKDEQGREILVGLDVEETAFLMDHRRKFAAGIRDHKGKKRAVELEEKHRLALYAVSQLRNEKPTRH